MRICRNRCDACRVTTSLWLALVTIPPVLLYAVLVHKSCRAVDPAAPCVGLLQVVPVLLASPSKFRALLTAIGVALISVVERGRGLKLRI